MEDVLTEEEVREYFPDFYNEVITSKKYSNVDKDSISWNMNYCIRLIGDFSFEGAMRRMSAEPEKIKKPSLDEIIKDTNETLGYSIEFRGKINGKKFKMTYSPERTNEASKFIIHEATERYNREMEEYEYHLKIMDNFNSILSLVGKKPNCFIGEHKRIYNAPTLDDVKKSKPELISEYEKKADGSKLIVYTKHMVTDNEWGFKVIDVAFGAKRLKADNIEDTYPKIFYWGDKMLWIYKLYPNGELRHYGTLNGKYDNYVNAEEGTEFRGWRKTLQYKLTKDEVFELIGNKIFE